MQIKITDSAGQAMDPVAVWNILDGTANTLGIKVISASASGRFTGFMLRPNGSKYRKINKVYGRNRRVNAVCFHGHYDFMDQLFRHYPDSVIKSSMINGPLVYKGYADFKRKAPELGYVNVGSMIYPVAYEDSCNCGEGE